jgi:phosphoglycerate kinase
MRSVRDIPQLENIPVLVRASLNVPVENGRITNDYRLRRMLPTLLYLQKKHARVILISHIGEAGTETLRPVAEALGTLIPDVSFSDAIVGEPARKAVRELLPGNILVLENLRRNRGEVTNDPEFAKQLSELGDVFVEDSFDTCHRPHASIVGLPKLLPSYAGLELEEEVSELTKALLPTHPALAVIGGAKFSTKEAVLTTLLERYDKVFVGGALANDFLKAAGHPVGKSLIGDGDEGIKKLLSNPKLVLPVDSLVVRRDAMDLAEPRSVARVASLDDVADDEVILDHGPATALLLESLVEKSKTILWNGPLGKYENDFTDTTIALARAVAKSHAHSLLGGGDTVAAIDAIGLLPKFSFVSIGGGAMLDFLAKGSLPGITALE